MTVLYVIWIIRAEFGEGSVVRLVRTERMLNRTQQGPPVTQTSALKEPHASHHSHTRVWHMTLGTGSVAANGTHTACA